MLNRQQIIQIKHTTFLGVYIETETKIEQLYSAKMYDNQTECMNYNFYRNIYNI